MIEYRIPVMEYFAWQQPVLDKDLTVPPVTPAKGDRYIVGAGATGDWSGEDDNIVMWTGSEWNITDAKEGFFTWVIDDIHFYRFVDGVWAELNVTGEQGIQGFPGNEIELRVDSGWIQWRYREGEAESDPIFSAWLATPPNISIFTNDSGYLTEEFDPVFTAWDKSTGISITESQISDLQAYLTTETDPVFTAWLETPPNISIFTNDSAYLTTVAFADLSDYPADDAGVLTNDGDGNLSWGAGGGGGANDYPQRATMWHDEATVITGNALARIRNIAYSYTTLSYQNVSADGDSFSNSFFLKAGTYTFSVLGTTTTLNAKIDWYVDGVKVVSLQDWYSGSTVNDVVKTASITVVGDGYHQLIGTVNGKTGTAYNITLTKYWLKPATDDPRIE